MASAKKGNLYRPDLRRNEYKQIWFRFSLNTTAQPKIEIYDLGGALKRTLDVGGDLPPGEYATRGRAIFWDRKDSVGGTLVLGVYFAKWFVDSVYQTQLRFSMDSPL